MKTVETNINVKKEDLEFFPLCKWLHIENWKDTQQNKQNK